VVVGGHQHPGIATGRDHRQRIGKVQRQRLLAQHMLARGGGGDHLITVQLVGRADVDHLHPRVGEQLRDRVIRRGDAVSGRERRCPLAPAARDSDHLVPALRAHRADHVLRSHRAGADETPTDGTLKRVHESGCTFNMTALLERSSKFASVSDRLRENTE
jgi:hypothetical protein